MIINSHEIDKNNSFLTAQYMPRPRIDKILDKATHCKLVYVIAGAGYGKTQAVRHYIEQQSDVFFRWVQLTENTNISSNFWEHFIHNVFFDNPKLAIKLREFGFPETLARFKQFYEMLKNAKYHSHYKRFIILDDFHSIYSKPILTFVEYCTNLQASDFGIIIISRKEPEINTVSLFSKGQVSIITEDELRFSEDEIAAFLKLQKIPFLPKNLPILFDVTKGWAIALQLLSLALKKKPDKIEFALNAMKQNIFKLLESEAFNDFPKKIQKALIKISMVDLPFIVSHNLFHKKSLSKDAPQLTLFAWFDSLTGDYRVHPLYLEFLQSKAHLLSHEEKIDTYCQVAQWCSENDFHMDAMRYFAKSHQFERMFEILLSYPFKLPHDTCEYFLNIIEELEPYSEQINFSILLLKNFFTPILLLGIGKYEEARERTFGVIREWEKLDTPIAINLLYASYSNLAYIDMYMCTITHKYDAPKYLKKSVEYYKLSSIPPVDVSGSFAVADIRSFACLVGEGAKRKEFDLFLEAARETAFYVAETFHDMYYGYEDLVACEIAFFQNQSETARNYAHSAILKAREKKQYSIAAMAEQYLLRLAVQDGDYLLVKEILKQLRGHLDNSDFWNRQLFYDFYVGSFYTHIGFLEMVPDWFVMNEKEATSEARIPIRELIANVRYYIATKKYEQALTVLCNSTPREPQERFLFGELMLTLLFAVVRINTGDTVGALANFQKAYELSFDGEFEMFFVELGKNLHPLVAAVSQQADCGIPAEWLKKINRKASVYAKKTSVISILFKKDNHIEDTTPLSKREQEVLIDLYHGLTREEIAITRYLSLPTVKKIIESLYVKLDANSIADAIRIAMKKKLITE